MKVPKALANSPAGGKEQRLPQLVLALVVALRARERLGEGIKWAERFRTLRPPARMASGVIDLSPNDSRSIEVLVHLPESDDRLVRRLVEHEFDHVFSGRFDGTPAPNAAEVGAWRWADVEEVRADSEDRPERYTAWFGLALARLLTTRGNAS